MAQVFVRHQRGDEVVFVDIADGFGLFPEGAYPQAKSLLQHGFVVWGQAPVQTEQRTPPAFLQAADYLPQLGRKLAWGIENYGLVLIEGAQAHLARVEADDPALISRVNAEGTAQKAR